MKSVKSSLRDINRPHPLVAAPMGGLFAVALTALFVPGPLELTEAWVLFASIGAGVGLGQFAYTRSHGRDSEGQT